MSCLYLVNDLFARIRNGYIRRSKYIKVFRSNATVEIVNLFYRKGLINNFVFSNNDSHYLYVELKYYNYKPVFSFILKSSKLRSLKMSYSDLRRMDSNKQQIYLIRNSQYGYILSSEMMLKGRFLGGEVLAVISLNNV